MKVVPHTRDIQVEYIPSQAFTCLSHNGGRISHKCAAVEAEVGDAASSRKYRMLVVAFITPINSPAGADQNQRRDKLVILYAYAGAGRRVRHHLNRPVHRRTMNRTVIVNNCCVRKIETERLVTGEPFALECHAAR